MVKWKALKSTLLGQVKVQGAGLRLVCRTEHSGATQRGEGETCRVKDDIIMIKDGAQFRKNLCEQKDFYQKYCYRLSVNITKNKVYIMKYLFNFFQLSGRILPRLFINSKQIGFLRIGWWMPTNDCISLYNHLFFQVNLVAMKMIHKKVDNYGETFFLPSMYT